MPPPAQTPPPQTRPAPAAGGAGSGRRASDWLAPALIYGSIALLLLPATRWLVRQTLAHEQLLASLSVLGIAGMLTVLERRDRLRPTFHFGPLSIRLAVAAYAALTLLLAVRSPFLLFVAYCCAIASGVIFIFGERVVRQTVLLIGLFAVYVGFVLTLPLLDWPLRGLAGNNAGWLLQQFGKEVALVLLNTPSGPALVMAVDGRPFTVAAECNGFGILSSSFLLSLLLLVYRRIPWAEKALVLFACVALGFVSNLARILAIILIAPRISHDSYHLMHEVVGGLVFYATLALVYWLSSPPRPRPRAGAAAASEPAG